MSGNYYELLGTHRHATADEIETAWRKTMLRVHPDRGGSTERAQAVNEAHEVLENPIERMRYDRLLDVQASYSARPEPQQPPAPPQPSAHQSAPRPDADASHDPNPAPPTGGDPQDRQRVRWSSVAGIVYIAWLIVTIGLAAGGIVRGSTDALNSIAIPAIVVLLALAVWGAGSQLVRIIGTTIGALIALAAIMVLIEAIAPSHANDVAVITGLVTAGVLLLTYACATFGVARQIRRARESQL